jgi:hypothetical protein
MSSREEEKCENGKKTMLLIYATFSSGKKINASQKN